MGRCKSLGLQESVCWKAPQLSGVNVLVFSIVNPVTSWGTVKNIHMWNLEFLRGGRVLWGRGGSGPLAWLWLPCPNALWQVSPTGSELSMTPAPLEILHMTIFPNSIPLLCSSHSQVGTELEPGILTPCLAQPPGQAAPPGASPLPHGSCLRPLWGPSDPRHDKTNLARPQCWGTSCPLRCLIPLLYNKWGHLWHSTLCPHPDHPVLANCRQ